jgi:hypothetical protein
MLSLLERAVNGTPAEKNIFLRQLGSLISQPVRPGKHIGQKMQRGAL